jgi:hypothetical protein
MAKNSGQPRRDLLSAHNVNGKGDAPRTNLASPNWRNNYDSIDWSGSVTGFRREGRRLIKRYGCLCAKPGVVEILPSGPPHWDCWCPQCRAWKT